MSGTTQRDADGDVVMAVSQPVFEFIQAPKLEDWSQAAIVKWRKARSQYESRMRQRCADSGESLAKALATVKDSFEPKLLEVVSLYELQTTVEEVTEEQLVKLIYDRTNNVMNEFVPDLDGFFRKNLKMDLREVDIDARVLKYYRDFSELIEQHGFGRLLAVGLPGDSMFEDRMKLRCKILLDNLEPQVLRDDVQRYVKYERRSAKKNDFELFRIIKERARTQHKYHVLNLEYKQKVDKSSDRKPSVKDVKPRKDREQRGGGDHEKPTASPSMPTARGKGANPPSEGCLHCGGAHWLRECPTASEEDRRRALEKLRSQRDGGRLRSKAVRNDKRQDPKTGEVLVNGMVTAPYCADSGSDRSIIPQDLVDELVELGSDVQLTLLSDPIVATVAGGGQVECTHEVVVDLQLQTAAGMVRVASVACLVMGGGETEFLLGDETLKSLGIDVHRQLEQLAGGDPVIDDDPFEPEVPPAGADVVARLDDMLVAVLREGFDPSLYEELRQLVFEYQDIFAIDVGEDPPASVEPLTVTLKPDAVPFRAKPRKYAPAQREFLRKELRRLEDIGYIRKNNHSRWACAVVPVAKPGRKMEFRMTIDYRPVNKQTVPIAGAAPNMDTITHAVAGAYGFSIFDLPKGFFQFPLAEASQELMSFISEDTVYSPTRVPQGGMDSSVHFQNQMQKIFADMLYTSLLLWIDDILVHAKSARALLDALQSFFERVRSYGLRLSAIKSCLFKKEAKWCGRMISGDGISHDPARLHALATLPLPVTGADLQQFLCAAGWLRDTLIDYARVAQPLHEKLESVLSTVGRTRRLAAGVNLEWTEAEIAAFEAIKSLISSSQPLAFPSDDSEVCVFSDASEAGWGLIVTQVTRWDDALEPWEQAHQLLVCKSGIFSGASKNWAIIDKEAFPIMWACVHLEYLLLRSRGFRLYCDHKNLIYIFDPSMELKRHIRGRLQRWALALTGLPSTREGTAASPDENNRLRPRFDGFVFPTLDEIKHAQTKHQRAKPTGAKLNDEHVLVVNEKLWLPERAKDLVRRVMIVAHCGTQGHRGLEPMMYTIQQVFFVRELSKVCRQFLSRCLLCKHTKGGNIVPRPWGPTCQATRRNEILHYDFLYMGDSMGSTLYVLVLKDGLTHYCELIACDSPTSDVAVQALLDWSKRFGTPEMLMSDTGSHFKNLLVNELCQRLSIEQHFVVAYSPWINGSVERINRDILQVMRVMLMELQLDTREWVYLLPLVQSNLNHTAVPSLNNHTPSELFTLLPAQSPLASIVVPRPKKNLILDAATQRDNVEDLREALHAMHREVIETKDARRRRNKDKSAGTPCNFTEGDFVLWSRIDSRLSNNKLLVRWVGPFEVTEALPHSFMVRHLVTNKTYNVHGSRLKFFADSSLDVTEELIAHVGNQGMVLEIEQFKDHRFAKSRNEWQLLVSWVGLQDEEDSWESLSAMAAEVPVKVNEYVGSSGSAALKTALASILAHRRSAGQA